MGAYMVVLDIQLCRDHQLPSVPYYNNLVTIVSLTPYLFSSFFSCLYHVE